MDDQHGSVGTGNVFRHPNWKDRHPSQFHSKPKHSRERPERKAVPMVKQVIEDEDWLRCLADDLGRSGYDSQAYELRCIAERIEQLKAKLSPEQ